MGFFICLFVFVVVSVLVLVWFGFLFCLLGCVFFREADFYSLPANYSAGKAWVTLESTGKVQSIENLGWYVALTISYQVCNELWSLLLLGNNL